jgi:hypothetical protein
MKHFRLSSGLPLLAILAVTACQHGTGDPANPPKASVEARLAALGQSGTPVAARRVGEFVGFDRNIYPGDDRMIDLHQQFAFVGYWLTVPPGEKENTWMGRRAGLAHMGYGFLVLANGRLDADIVKAKGTAQALGKRDAAEAIAAADREGFPDQTILFLDQEEGGRLLPEQSAYFFAWTEAVAASKFRPGAYLSGQASDDGVAADGHKLTTTTAKDVREQIAARHLHPVALWVAQDTCPPAPGCTLQAPHVKESGTLDAAVWQYAQSPRRPELTRTCAKTYAKDGSCYAGVSTDLAIDLDVADSADPSHGR